MKPATEAPRRPLLRYFGGKWQMRHWIVSHLPEHRFYAEPFAGAASVLLAKAPAPGGEILNDLNRDLITLFRVLQDRAQGDELIRRLSYTPYAKAELELAREPTDDPIERARRLVVRSFMGIEVAGGASTKSGFRMGNVDLSRLDQEGTRTFRNCGKDWQNWRVALPAIRDRLAGVMIYERPAAEFIQLMDSPQCLLYVDPPYHPDTRAKTRYTHDMDGADHAALLKQLLGCKAKSVLSGYPHPSYDILTAAGWRCVQRQSRANMSTRTRVECLWLNF